MATKVIVVQVTQEAKAEGLPEPTIGDQLEQQHETVLKIFFLNINF